MVRSTTQHGKEQKGQLFRIWNLLFLLGLKSDR